MLFSDEKTFEFLVIVALTNGLPQKSVIVPSIMEGEEHPIEKIKKLRKVMNIPTVLNLL